ncbi:MAG: hypothetical protein KH231_06265 [Dialister sp.]|uniref:hypothetical protein n=1 Tax=Dialister sp. TaxID=1955814 RepID=UPI001D61E790|nr:hypothetical protein [Dialister sp.]MBS6715061.1 hypothetical protein [Dialister sp.]
MNKVKDYIKKHTDRALAIGSVLAIVLLIAILASYSLLLKPYSQMIDAVCAEEYGQAISAGEALPDGYRESDEIIAFAVIARDFNENDRESYAETLDDLAELSSIENKKVKPVYEKFVAHVTSLQKQYLADQKTAADLSDKIAKATTYSSDEELLSKEAEIDSVRQEYNNSESSVTSLVTNISDLEDAEEKIDAMKSASEVVALINAIGTVTLDSGDKITAASVAYGNLSDMAQGYVSNRDTLVDAESRLKELQEEKEREEQRRLEEERRREEEKWQAQLDDSGDGDDGDYYGGTVYYVSGGEVYHSTPDCPTLSRSTNIHSGSPPSGRRPCKVCY